MENMKKMKVRNYINITFISLSSYGECIARLDFNKILNLFDLKL